MTISINLTTTPRRIFVPKADTTLVSSSPDIRSLDMDFFHNELRTLEADILYTVEPITHNHTQEGTLGGTTYPRRVEILTDYEVEFEDGAYRVRLIGGDSNIEDVAIVNNVSISTFNSAGNSVVDIDKILTVPKFLALK